MATILSLEPFVPSGSNFEGSKELFLELGFTITWDAGDCVGFARDGWKFILQKFDNKAFAENLMISVRISNVEEFRSMVLQKTLTERFAIRLSDVTKQAYGKEVNLIDIAGVCWHFVE